MLLISGQCAVIRYGNGTKKIGIWGHLDVVPEGTGWLYPPFSCTRKGDFLIGRGVQDNKGPAIAFLYAMRYLKEKGMVPCVTFLQILGCREEVDMEGCFFIFKRKPGPGSLFCDGLRISGVLWGKRNLQSGIRIGET